MAEEQTAGKKQKSIIEEVKEPIQKAEQVIVEEVVSIDQFFHKLETEVHTYTKAAYSHIYRGLLKTMEEWKLELKDKI